MDSSGVDAGAVTGGAGHVLVIEDDQMMRAVEAAVLRAAGWVVGEAASGLEGIELARQTAPDVIVCDRLLPDLDGLAVIAHLAGEPATSAIPVVLVTALGAVDDVVAGIEAGAHDYLTKPFEPVELQVRCHAALRVSRQHQRLTCEVSARRLAEERLQDLFDASGVGMTVTDAATGRTMAVNDELCRWLDYARDEIVGHDVRMIFDPDDLATVDAALTNAGDDGVARVEVRCRRRDGTYRWSLATVRRPPDPAGDGAVMVLAQYVDITERVEAAAALHVANARFAVTFENAPTGTALIDLAGDPGRIQQGNWALAQFAGLALDDLPACYFADLLDAADRDGLIAVVDDLAAGRTAQARFDARVTTVGGEVRWADVSINAMIDDHGLPSYAIAQVEDTTERQAREAFLSWQSGHDALTGLANRAALVERLGNALAHRASADQLGVLFVDLDGFKAVNDTYGHSAGDVVIITVARRLETATRLGDVVARLGGDEFVVVLERCGDDSELCAIAQRVVDSVAAPIAIASGAVSVAIGASVGIARPSHATTAVDDVLAVADAAMYIAKQGGKSRYHYGGQESPGALRPDAQHGAEEAVLS